MPRQHEPAFTPEAASASASGGAGERQSLPALQAKMKRDPEGYEAELRQLRRHFESSVFLFRQQAALASTSSSGGGGEVAKELGDLALFLAHVAPFYPDDLADLPDQIGGLLDTNARALPSGLRVHLVQALILLVNRKLFGFAYGGPFGHFLHKVLDYIFKGKKDTKTVAKKSTVISYHILQFREAFQGGGRLGSGNIIIQCNCLLEWYIFCFQYCCLPLSFPPQPINRSDQCAVLANSWLDKPSVHVVAVLGDFPQLSCMLLGNISQPSCRGKIQCSSNLVLTDQITRMLAC